MKFKLFQYAEGEIVELFCNLIIINSLDNALSLIGNTSQQRSQRIIVHQRQLHPDFFELRKGLTGEILQKFSTYRMQLAIVGNFENTTSISLKDFFFESYKYGHIFFANRSEQTVRHIRQL